MKYYSILFLLFISVFSTDAQDNARNNFYGEARGFAGPYSINYERLVRLTRKPYLLAGVNGGFCYEHHYSSKGIALPAGVKVCLGVAPFYGEFGGDILFVRQGRPDHFYGGWKTLPNNSQFTFWHAGIRYQRLKKGLFVRAMVFPVRLADAKDFLWLYYGARSIYDLEQKGKQHIWWGGLDIGYTF